jgi:hypothetical protein
MNCTLIRLAFLFLAVNISAHAADIQKKPAPAATDAGQLWEKWNAGVRGDYVIDGMNAEIRSAANVKFFLAPGKPSERVIGETEFFVTQYKEAVSKRADELKDKLLERIKNAVAPENQKSCKGKGKHLYHMNSYIWVYTDINRSKVVLLQNEQKANLFRVIAYFPEAKKEDYKSFLTAWENFFVQYSSRIDDIKEAYGLR